MPKVKPIKSAILKNYVSEFGDVIFSSDGSIVFCKMYEMQICADKRYIVTQHLKTDKHSRAVNKKNITKSQVQQLVTNTKKSIFSFDLCKALMSNESTDTSGRFIANVVIGTLEFDQPGKIFLLTTEILEKANHSTIVKLFDKSMFILWPNGIRHDDVLLILSDAAPYMVKAASTIKVLYSKIVHITCQAHGIHRVAETIRSNFPKINKLIAKVKQIFLKAPSGILLFKKEAPVSYEYFKVFKQFTILKYSHAYHKTRLGAKKHGADIYPSYDRVRLAKYRCYPENIIISEISASVPLQNLLDHTIKRLWETLDFDDTINYAEEYSELKFICKWGCDGSSGHSEYHQSFHDIETDDTECRQNAITDSSIVLFCIVPLRLTGVIKVSNTRVILWENPTPSSTRYCRPLKFLYAKETKEVTKTEVGRVENEIMKLKSVELNINNSVLCINYTMLMTMVDGKVINTLTESSSQLCYICKCHPTNMNDLDNIKRFVVNEDNVKYGMSSLHAWIKFLELVLHIAYKLESAATTKRTTSEQKKKIEEKKKEIQFRLWNELGIKVDKVFQGRSTSNTGNVARRFFRNTEKVAEITGIDLNLLNRFSTTLTVIFCGYEINYDEFENYAKDTAELYVKHYN
ncbi:hypothetical protein QTP88_002065 [Uroleucon formosanum]